MDRLGSPSSRDNPEDWSKAVRHAEHYDQERFGYPWGQLYRAREERALRQALQPLRRHGRILDVACGTGRVTGLLVREGFRDVVGTDVSRAMMGVAKRRLPNVEFFQGDVTRLPVDEENSFV